MTDNPVDDETAFAFPVITRIAVHGYQLFPGAHGEGFERDLPAGVTIVAGVNGLGKTTLLHVLYRSLTGPSDSGLAPSIQLGSQRPTVRSWDPRPFFAGRVEDGADGATASLDVAFGNSTVRLRRALRDLSLEQLIVDGAELPATEDEYRAVVTRLAGLPRFEDFLVLLQYLVFVFEERPRLVWDPTAQSELFRFVFNPAAVAASYRAAFDRIATEDSARRNVRVQVNKLRSQLTSARAAAAVDRATRAQIELRQVEIEAVDDTVRSASARIDRIDEERRRVRESLVQDQHRHEEAHGEYARVEQQYLQSVFPTAEETARLVFARSDTGCLICGDRSGAARRRIQSQVDRRRCPLCDSPAPPSEPGIVPLATVEQARLRRAGDEAEVRRIEILDRERRLETLALELRDASEGLGAAVRQKRELEREVIAFEARLPPDDETVTRMGQQLETLEDQLARHELSQREAEQDLGRLVDETRRRVELARDTLRDRFQTYASAFLEETCELVYEASERRVGQEGQLFRFPRFHVRMTTALSHDEGRPRLTDSQVSESQKEFIDLAFRMALVSSLIGPADDAMIVLETPESSLDQVFAARAGRLLGLFAREGGRSGNRLIASSNVTDGPMIAALLGAVDERLSTDRAETQPHYVPPDDRPRHVLDLLTIAAETAAVRKYRTEYTAALRRAMYPENAVTA